jgi:ketosteroid isomerase-like protein
VSPRGEALREGTPSSAYSAVPVSPERVLRGFAAAIGAGDLEAATSCFARDACLTTPDATTVRGRDSIRPVLAQLILIRTEIAVELCSVLIVAETALVRGGWRISSNAAEGARLEQATAPVMVMHLIEGDWKLRIAAPWR